jgi:hypothetical protein
MNTALIPVQMDDFWAVEWGGFSPLQKYLGINKTEPPLSEQAVAKAFNDSWLKLRWLKVV